MKNRILQRVSLIVLLAFCLSPLIALAAENALLTGQVLDADGRPVAGVRVQAFDSAQVKRPADFVSEKSTIDGIYRLTLPAGTYWAVAVLRVSGADFGPLQMGDRHSGEPMTMTVAAGATVERDFTVFGLQEAARRHTKENADLVRLIGRVEDARHRPVAGMYVMADAKEKISDFPAYFSGWTGKDGAFELFVPPGVYHLGSTNVFPPASGDLLPGSVTAAKGLDTLIVPSGHLAPEAEVSADGPDAD